jgi:hypothetical protein
VFTITILGTEGNSKAAEVFGRFYSTISIGVGT